MERRRFESLGSECELYAIGTDADALAAAESWTRRMHDRLTRFEPRSEVSRFNASGGRWVAVSLELAALLRESLRAFEVSDGLVNVAVLPALLATGYTRDFDAGPTAATDPPPVPALPEVLQLRPGEARLAGGAAIDLGGIAKAGSRIVLPNSSPRTRSPIWAATCSHAAAARRARAGRSASGARHSC